MPTELTGIGATRMLFLGDAALTDGFQLIGFETWADPTSEQLDRLLQELLDTRCNAFIILDNRLSEHSSELLDRVRREGGRIVVTEVPPLNDPDRFNSEIDARVSSLMGNAGLMERSEHGSGA